MTQQSIKASAYWSVPADQLLASLQTSKNGLSSAEAEKCLKEWGPNSLKATQRATPLLLFLNQFKDPALRSCHIRFYERADRCAGNSHNCRCQCDHHLFTGILGNECR